MHSQPSYLARESSPPRDSSSGVIALIVTTLSAITASACAAASFTNRAMFLPSVFAAFAVPHTARITFRPLSRLVRHSPLARLLLRIDATLAAGALIVLLAAEVLFPRYFILPWSIALDILFLGIASFVAVYGFRFATASRPARLMSLLRSCVDPTRTRDATVSRHTSTTCTVVWEASRDLRSADLWMSRWPTTRLTWAALRYPLAILGTLGVLVAPAGVAPGLLIFLASSLGILSAPFWLAHAITITIYIALFAVGLRNFLLYLRYYRALVLEPLAFMVGSLLAVALVILVGAFGLP